MKRDRVEVSPAVATEVRLWEMTEVLFDARWIGNHGIGRFAGELLKTLPGLVSFHVKRRPWHPLDPVLLGASLRRVKPKLFFSPGYNSPLGWPGTFIFTLHDLNHLCVPDNSNALKRAYYQYVIKPACKRAAFVLTVSDYSRREIVAWAQVDEERIINVGNGVSAPFIAVGSRYEPGFPYLLYVGSRKPHKNLPRLLQAYAISGVRKDVRLLLSGHPDRLLLMEIGRLQLGSSVVFAELQSDDVLSDTYRGAVALLFPSLYEGFGLPPLEAMACGLPVLTSNVCSIPETVGDAAILVRPMDVEDIAEGIKRLVGDAALRLQLREKGLSRAKLFSWEETSRRTSRILDLAVGRELVHSVGCEEAEKLSHEMPPPFGQQ